ncbi:phage late control D family protein [Bradyrhizobium lablabi]|uniref:phage late control D family protein n=1 Tax=Bradyrhizobium lablabi TaxID=722472 RepID=UPI001BA831B9|nr:hypothetical protein [Bradyrhizobium lablabi]MBR0693685.1 hypothetical protein [Bradyrhizobium lablabi]
MAISSGVGPHAAWLNVAGGQFPIEHGNVEQTADRKTSSFSGVIPMALNGARATFAGLAAGTEASVIVMTRGQTATLITGELDEVGFDYIARTIRFRGRDKSSKLHENNTSEKWLNKKPSEIVQDLIGRVGLSGNVAASLVKAGKQLQQDFVKLSENNTFARIIHEMARLDGARWWVDPQGQFHYQPIGSPEGVYSITINQEIEPISADCVELRVLHNLQAARPVAVTVRGWHPKKRQIFSYTSNVEGKGPKLSYFYQVPTLTEDHARRHAKSEATEKARHELLVHATVVGDPSVQAGMGLQLNGTDFDQTYDIDHVSHDFGMSGHRTHISARSPKSGRSAS